MSTKHSALLGDELHVAFRWVQEGDPGAGADHPGHYWLKLSTGDLKRRKDDDSGWDPVGGASGGITNAAFTAKGDLLAGTGVGTKAALAVGADGTFLRAHSVAGTGLQYYDHEGAADPHPVYALDSDLTGYQAKSTLTTKGDLYIATASGVVTRIGVGADGDVLTADSGATPGVSWQAGGGGGSTIGQGTYGSLPAPGTAGNLYLATDAPVFFRDNGAAWIPFGPVFHFTRGTWPATAYNHTSETVTDHGWGQSIVAPNNGSTGSTNWVGVEKVAPSTPYIVDMFFRINAFVRQYQCWGYFIRDSGTGKWTGVQVNFGSGGGLAVLHQNSATSNAGVPLSMEIPLITHDMWWRMEDDATNIKFSVSADGVNWIQLYSEARASFMTTPDRVGWALNNQTSTVPMIGTLLSWYEH